MVRLRPAAQLAGRRRSDEAELGDRRLRPSARVGARTVVGSVEHVGDGAEGDAGACGDVLDAHRGHGSSSRHSNVSRPARSASSPCPAGRAS